MSDQDKRRLILEIARGVLDYKGVDELENFEFLEYLVAAVIVELSDHPEVTVLGANLPSRKDAKFFRSLYLRGDTEDELDFKSRYGLHRAIYTMKMVRKGVPVYARDRIRALHEGFTLVPDAPDPIPDPDDDD